MDEKSFIVPSKDEMLTMPYCIYESERWRNERTVRRLILVIILTVVLLFASNGIWLYAWMQYDYSSEETMYQQDGEGYNNINTGTQGDVDNGADFDDTEKTEN